MIISPGIRGLQFEPQTQEGTLISIYTMYFNISDGSPLHTFNASGMIEISVQSNAIKHFGKETLPNSSYQFPYYYHDYRPQFTIHLPGFENSTLINAAGPIDSIFPVSSSAIETCLRAGSKFLVVPVEIYLSSPFFYHLGHQWLLFKVAIIQNVPKKNVGVVVNNLFVNISAGWLP